MQQNEQTAGLVGSERRRVEAVVETLATLGSRGESLAEVAHDARNMVTALGLYCDLLEEPGVLATEYFHYGSELRLVAAASRRLVEKLVALDTRIVPFDGSVTECLRERDKLPVAADKRQLRASVCRSQNWDMIPAEPIDNLALELKANQNLLSALAGPLIAVSVDAEEGFKPVRLTAEDLTRVLINLVKNSAEAISAGGWIRLSLKERKPSSEAQPCACTNAASTLLLTLEDNGPGIDGNSLEKIFDSGYSTHAQNESRAGSWPGSHRGLGLSISRSIIEGAGGRIHAVNLSPAGARFEIEFPIRNR